MVTSINISVMDEDKEELRPGDDGFDGFQRQLPENCVDYMLFILGSVPKTDETDARKTLFRLEAVRKEAVRLSDDLTRDYIWQREAFSLQTKTDKGSLELKATDRLLGY